MRPVLKALFIPVTSYFISHSYTFAHIHSLSIHSFINSFIHSFMRDSVVHLQILDWHGAHIGHYVVYPMSVSPAWLAKWFEILEIGLECFHLFIYGNFQYLFFFSTTVFPVFLFTTKAHKFHISYISNLVNMAIRNQICQSLEIRYCGM